MDGAEHIRRPPLSTPQGESDDREGTIHARYAPNTLNRVLNGREVAVKKPVACGVPSLNYDLPDRRKSKLNLIQFVRFSNSHHTIYNHFSGSIARQKLKLLRQRL